MVKKLLSLNSKKIEITPFGFGEFVSCKDYNLLDNSWILEIKSLLFEFLLMQLNVQFQDLNFPIVGKIQNQLCELEKGSI